MDEESNKTQLSTTSIRKKLNFGELRINKSKINISSFFQLNLDWLIYFGLSLLLIISIEGQVNRNVSLYTLIIGLTAILFVSLLSTSTVFFLNTKLKEKIFEQKTLLTHFIWHTGGLIFGLFLYLLIITSNNRNDYFKDFYPFFYLILTLFLGYFCFALSLLLVMDITNSDYASKTPKTVISQLKKEYAITNRTNTRIGYYTGVCVKWLYGKLIEYSKYCIIAISYIMIFLIFTIFPLLLLYSLFICFFTYPINVFLTLVLFFAIFFSIVTFLLRKLVQIQQFASKHFILFLFNFMLGLDRNYYSLNANIKEKDKFSRDNPSQHEEKLKNWICRTINDWEPIIELSFILIAFFYFFYKILGIPDIFSFLTSIFFAPIFLISVWVFEDLDIGTNIPNNNNAQTLFNFVKIVRFSKSSIQLASIYTIGIWLLETQSTTQEFSLSFLLTLPIISFLFNTFRSLIIIILYIMIINIFSWIYIRILRPDYRLLLLIIQKRIDQKTSFITSNLNRITQQDIIL